MLRLIAGVLSRDGAVPDEGVVHAMLDAMNPNGLAESRAVRSAGSAALGVLSLAPEGASRAPAEAEIRVRGRRLIAADARVYRTGQGFDALDHGPGDDAILADAIAAEPGGFLRDFEGDIAAAVWDPDAATLMLFRDHFGVRPLCWCDRPGRDFAFASLPGPIFAAGFARRVVDPNVMVHCHRMPCPPPGRTFFRDVHAVAPAHEMTVRPRRAPRARRYWRLAIPHFLPFDSDPNDLADGVSRRIETAVRRRVSAEGPLGGHLSGGLDSSTIAVHAARAVRDEGREYYGYSQQEPRLPGDPPVVDEAPYVAAIGEAEPNIRIVPVHGPGVYQMIEAGLNVDTMNPLSETDTYLAPIRHAARHGIGVMFSGWGGDEFASNAGRGAETELLLHGRFRQLARHIQDRRAKRGGNFAGVFVNLALIRLLPFGLTERLRRWLAAREPRTHDGFLPDHRRHRLHQNLAYDFPDTRLNRRHFGEAWWLAHKLTIFAQQGAPHGVATTYPLLDLDLVNYVMRIPGVFFRRAGGYRTLMRDAVRGVLPDLVRLRDEKLMPFPLESLRMACEVERIGPRLDRLETEPLVREFVDIAKVRRFVGTLEGRESVTARTAEAAQKGEQYAPRDDDHINALFLASWLECNAGLLELDETT